jgi:hypothetical protein
MFSSVPVSLLILERSTATEYDVMRTHSPPARARRGEAHAGETANTKGEARTVDCVAEQRRCHRRNGPPSKSMRPGGPPKIRGGLRKMYAPWFEFFLLPLPSPGSHSKWLARTLSGWRSFLARSCGFCLMLSSLRGEERGRWVCGASVLPPPNFRIPVEALITPEDGQQQEGSAPAARPRHQHRADDQPAQEAPRHVSITVFLLCLCVGVGYCIFVCESLSDESCCGVRSLAPFPSGSLSGSLSSALALVCSPALSLSFSYTTTYSYFSTIACHTTPSTDFLMRRCV